MFYTYFTFKNNANFKRCTVIIKYQFKLIEIKKLIKEWRSGEELV